MADLEEKKYVSVLVDINKLGTKTFSYLIPDELKDKIKVGQSVLVPFGRRKEGLKAYVVGFSNYLEEGIKAKYITEILENEPLYKHTTFKVGGPARLFIYIENIEALKRGIQYCREHQVKHMVIGRGSDLLFSDKEYEGVIFSLKNLNKVHFNGVEIRAQAGVSMIYLAYEAAKVGLSGFEFMGGIPGTIGGGVYMNAGAYKYCISDVFYGTDYHSHLGTRRGGMAVNDANGRIVRIIHDITNAQFRSKFDDDLNRFCGNTGIGVISDYEDQPLLVTSKLGRFAIATVGKINNMDELFHKLLDNRCAHFAESCEDELNPTELVAAIISQRDSFLEGIKFAQEVIDGSCSILILHGNTIYAARDYFGRTPVVIGEKEGAFAVSMETTAFPNLDYSFKRELGPGEIVLINSGTIETLRKQNVLSVSDVKYGVIEPDGTLSVILKQPQQPVTAEMLGITPKDVGLPLVVVSDGRLVRRSLRLLHLDEQDIENRLKNQSIALSDVFLMTLDDCGNSFVQRKEHT